MKEFIVVVLCLMFFSCGEYSSTPTVIIEQEGKIYAYYDNTVWLTARKREVPKELIDMIKETP